MSEEEASDPRDARPLLRRVHPLGEVGEAEASSLAQPPPEGAICEKCGSTWVSTLPFFAAGSGLAFRPVANDIACQRCGHLGPADFA